MKSLRPLSPIAALPLLARHQEFLALRACGARQTTPGTRLERVLRRPQRVLINQIALAVHAAFGLRQSVYTQQILQRAAAHSRDTLRVQQQLLRVIRERSDRRLQVAHLHTERQWQLRERVLQVQQQRVLLPQAEALVMRRAEERSAYPRMNTAVAQTAAARSNSTEARTPVDADFIASVKRDAATATAPQLSTAWSLPPQELARLTTSVSNQVISQLERRALSARERSGRI